MIVAACAAPPPQPTPPASAPTESTEVPATEALPVVTPAPAPLPDPDRLLGLEPRQLQDVLGTPSLVRREGAAQVMQFKNGNCILDVIFYEEAAGGAFRAQHLASRMTDGTPFEPQDCLVAILPDGKFPVGMVPEEISSDEVGLEVMPEDKIEDDPPEETPPA